MRVYDENETRAAHTADALNARDARTPESAVEDADVIFEAVVEDVAVKRALYERIGPAAPNAIVAPNTSSIAPDILASSLANPSRFAVAHFFNPPEIVPLVEIVRASHTEMTAIQDLVDLVTAAGRVPVVLGRAVPRFVANRLQAALLREAFALEAAGVASFADIDLIVRAGLGWRWAAAGPFAVVDPGGPAV